MKKKYANIFEYIDFRKFLADYYKKRKAEDKSFTQTYICKNIGLPNTRSYFMDILSGKRNLSNNKMEPLLEMLELEHNEAQFFRFLVQYNQTTVKSEKDFFFDQLISLNRTPRKFIDKKSYEYYKEWYHSAIRALLDIYDFDGNYSAIAAKLEPAISPKKARQSIELLKKLGLIEKNRDGYWKPTEKNITSGSYLQDEMLKSFQVACLDLAKHSIFSNTEKNQKNTTKTISISEEGFKKIEKRYKKFISEVSSIVHKDEHPADRVYQLSVNLYPQSK